MAASSLTPNFPHPAPGPCWVCKRPVSWWRFGVDATWHGKSYCWEHHPLTRKYPTVPNTRRYLVFLRAEDEPGTPWAHRHWGVYRNTRGTSATRLAKLEREVDAKRGVKKTKPAKPRKKPRDRQYIR